MSAVDDIRSGATALGIELGSTRIKAVLIGPDHQPLATGSHEWRSELVDGHWSYPLDAVWTGVQQACAALRADVAERHDEPLHRVGALGVSAMMHGYLAFDADDHLLVPFRTWQDTTTLAAAAELTELFQLNIPARWSIAHLHQAILDDEPHVAQVAHLTTLAGLVHQRLTGRRVLGVGDASGMFPVAADGRQWDAERLAAYDALVAHRGFDWRLADLLPQIAVAGEAGGTLTPDGARLLDPTGELQPGALVAPPEGDAGTGMVATNAVAPRTANVSAGTSIFAMVVTERPLTSLHTEIDLVTTPAGAPVAMVHCNNGAADLHDWVMMLGEAARALGAEFTTDELFATLYRRALTGAADAAGMVAFNYRAGEPITGMSEGRPMVVRLPDTPLRLDDFMRAQLYSTLATLRLGFDILETEGVEVDALYAHGGLFRTRGVAQRFLASALNVPVTVSDTASEGGAWGMALLAQYALLAQNSLLAQTTPQSADASPGNLATWLADDVFAGHSGETCAPNPGDVAGFGVHLERYRAALAVQAAAVTHLTR